MLRCATRRAAPLRAHRRAFSAAAPHAVIHVNGQRFEATDTESDGYLIDFLRERGFRSPKLACGEGGCGACTVMVSDTQQNGKVRHRAINSCLMNANSAHGTHVTTAEGIGTVRDGLHPVQEHMAQCFGSQCGFCTPGFTMSLYSHLVANRKPTVEALEKSIDGNLCRCTGYRPIADAVRALQQQAAEQEPAQFEAVPLPDAVRDFDWSQELHVRDGCGGELYAPRSLDALLRFKAERGSAARLVVGNSEVAIEQRFGGAHSECLVDVSGVGGAMHALELGERGALRLGAAADLTRVWRWLEEEALPRMQRDEEREVARAICEQLYWFSGTSVRNGACIGGNVATASPISDLNPVWVATDAVFVLQSASGGERRVPARAFFTGYRQVDMRDDEVLVAVDVPAPRDGQRTVAYKQGQRREDDIAIVTACLSAVLSADGVVEAASLAFGGMAVTTVTAAAAEQAMVGHRWDRVAFDAACEALVDELRLPADVPGGRAEYRLALCQGFLYKFFLHTSPEADACSARERSALDPLPHTVPRGEQSWEEFGDADAAASDAPWRAPAPADAHEPTVAPVHRPEVHINAAKQVTGEAAYTDDLPPVPGELHAALVLSDRPYARVLGIDASEALALPGVERVLTHADVKGSNVIGDIVRDEELFASTHVRMVGQMLGVVVAADERTAQRAARLVRVQYGDADDRPPVLSIDDAIEHDRFTMLVDGLDEHVLERGDVDAALAAAPPERIVEGRVRIGAQEHFYFEPQCTVARPEDGGEMLVYASTQNMHRTQMTVAEVLGVPMHRVSAKARRIGGGFGGKETASIAFSCAAATAADAVQRPVRLVLPRDVDMIVTGKRHPFIGEYRVAFDDDGAALGVDVRLYSNGGWSYDLSGPVLDRALLHSDNAYQLPNVRVRGRICRTDLPTNTAFRGFGGPQGMIVCEAWLEHVARRLGKRAEEVRLRNLYRPEDRTPYGQQVVTDLRAIWDRCEAVSSWSAVLAETEQYNAAHRWRKRGVSMVPCKFGLGFTFATLNQGSALVHVYGDGSVVVTHGGVEMGQGLHTKVAQVAARALGVPLSSVHVQDTSTEKIANSSATAASMGSDLYAMATLDACTEIRERLRPLQERMPEATFAELVDAAYHERVNLSAHAYYKVPIDGYNFATHEGTPFSYFTSGVAAVVSEIDALTGDSRLLRTDIVMDVGASLNPAIDIGQIEGAFVQGYGWLTLEDLRWGAGEHARWLKPGHIHAPGPGMYKIPSLDDIPRVMNVHLMQGTRSRTAVHSSRGVGEPPLLLGAATIFSLRDAIAAARKESGLSEWVPADFPLSAERIRMACGDRFTQQAAPETWKEFNAAGSW